MAEQSQNPLATIVAPLVKTFVKVRLLERVSDIDRLSKMAAANLRLVLKAQNGTLPKPNDETPKTGGAEEDFGNLMSNISLGDTTTTHNGLGKLGAAALGTAMLLGGGGAGLGAASLLGLLGGDKPPAVVQPTPVVDKPSPEFEDTTFDLRLAK